MVQIYKDIWDSFQHVSEIEHVPSVPETQLQEVVHIRPRLKGEVFVPVSNGNTQGQGEKPAVIPKAETQWIVQREITAYTLSVSSKAPIWVEHKWVSSVSRKILDEVQSGLFKKWVWFSGPAPEVECDTKYYTPQIVCRSFKNVKCP